MKPILSILSAMLLAVASYADGISIQSRYSVGDPITPTTDFVARGYEWESPTARLLVIGEGKEAHVWAAVGTHTIRLTAVTDDYQLHHWVEQFVVDNAAPAPPISTLRSLMTNEEVKTLVDYLTWAETKVTPTTTATTFWTGWDATFPLGNNKPLVEALKSRLSEPLSAPERLRQALRDIVAELSQPAPPRPTPTPTPTPPTIGARYVLIAHESGDKKQWFGELGIDLRKPGGPADVYFHENHHTLDILDDELVKEGPQKAILTPLLNQLPVAIIMDAQRTQVLKTVPLSPGVTADNITEYVRQTGG